MQSCLRAGIKPTTQLVHVSIPTQSLVLFEKGELQRTYSISTSARPASNLRDSHGTPTGLHAVADKIGSDEPSGMVFKARVPTGQTFSEMTENDRTPNLITSRILRLRGLEPGINAGGEVDSYERYIYIHGTNREDAIGRPQSAGCVLMSNRDVIEFYDTVEPGTIVLIESAPMAAG